MSILLTLASIAATLMLTDMSIQIGEQQAHGKEVSPNQVAGLIEGMMAEARSKGTDTYNKLLNKIAAIPVHYIQSATVKKALQQRRKKLTSTAEEVGSAINKLENTVSADSQRLNALINQSDSYRNKYGKQVVDDIKTTTEAAINKFNQTLQGVETNV